MIIDALILFSQDTKTLFSKYSNIWKLENIIKTYEMSARITSLIAQYTCLIENFCSVVSKLFWAKYFVWGWSSAAAKL